MNFDCKRLDRGAGLHRKPGWPSQISEKPPVIRRSERQPLFLAARFRHGGQTSLCNLIDLSESGCRLRITANFVDVGSTVFIKLERLEALTGTVRWKDDDWMGIEFHEAVYRPVVDHLVKSSTTTLRGFLHPTRPRSPGIWRR